jgi:hypothetical protein
MNLLLPRGDDAAQTVIFKEQEEVQEEKVKEEHGLFVLCFGLIIYS